MAGLTKEQKAAIAAENATKSARAAEQALLAIMEPKAIELSGLTAEAFAALPDDQRADLFKAVAENEPDAPSVDDGLIAMTKDGETLRLHVDSVADHKRLGWIEA